MCILMDSTNTKVYVSDRHLISRIDMVAVAPALSWVNNPTSGEQYTVTEFVGDEVVGFVNGNSTATRFFEPVYITMDKSDKYMYVSDLFNYAIRRVDMNYLVAPTSASPFTTVTYAAFTSPNKVTGIVLDAAGANIYATAYTQNGIFRIPVQTSFPVLSTSWVWVTNRAIVFGQMVEVQFDVTLWF